MFKSKRANTAAIFTLILLICELKLYGYMFPWTGLAAIIFIPTIYIIVFVTILLGMIITRNMKTQNFVMNWVIIILITTTISITLYPQEFRPNVSKQIINTFRVIYQYNKINEDDLNLYNLDNFTRHDCAVIDSRERYVAALHKFQKKIPRDGSHFLFGREENPVLEHTDLKSKLITGQDKIIWWVLEKKNKQLHTTMAINNAGYCGLN